MTKTMNKIEDQEPFKQTQEGMFLTKVLGHGALDWYLGSTRGELESSHFWAVVNFCKDTNIQTIDQLIDLLTEYDAIEEGQKELEETLTKTEPNTNLNPTNPEGSQPEDALFREAAELSAN